MLDYVNTLLEMADFLDRTGDRALARSCRDTANKMLDHLLYYVQQMAANGQQMKGAKA